MLKYYPRCHSDGSNIVYDVPSGVKAARPLHLIDLIGYVTFADSRVSTKEPSKEFLKAYPWSQGEMIGDIERYALAFLQAQ